MEGDAARPPSNSAPVACCHSEPPAGVLLEAPRGIREGWAEEVGKPHRIGIKLNVSVRFIPSDENGIDYQIRGVVDVPSPPYGDDERSYLAKVLVDSAEIPQGKCEYAVLHWVATEGGDGVRVDKCGPILHLTEDDIFDLKMFTAPDVEETDDNDGIGSDQHNEWVREYGANRYCRYETRQELHQRYQDIWANTQVLTRSGKMGLTIDKNWYRLQQHVIAEMLLRGEPPRPSNHDPRVREARPFFDGELCRKAASVVSVRGTDRDVLVKYGKRKHMEALFQHGYLYLNSAASYNESVHNQAVQDEELAIDFKGGYIRATDPIQFYERKNPPPEHVVDSGVGFRAMHEVPGLNHDQYATMTIRMVTDYWMLCMADGLDQRLFADFEADSCLIIRRKPFVERLLRMATLQVPNAERHFDRVQYVDPLGALPVGATVARSIPIHMTKMFRYAYQREVRLALLPRKFREQLEPRVLHIGSISDIAEIVQLADWDARD